jgi:dTDP-glucose 4,6-dehydratase
MNDKKIVYITGCLGFIGSYVTTACLDKGWYVRGIDKMTYAAQPSMLEKFQKYTNFSFEQKDICDINRLIDCDYIINTAAETHVDNSINKSDDFLHSNIDGVYNILELLRTYNRAGNIPILIHFSTDEVYGDIMQGMHTELDLLKPSNPYSATKAAADQLIIAWGRTYKIPYIIVRPTNNYGIGQYVEKLIPKACKFLFLGRKIPLHHQGLPRRTWLHAQDTANAIISIINKGVKNQIYNISGNYEDSNINIIKKILYIKYKDEYNIDNYVDFNYIRVGQDLRYSIDDSKLKSLGWSNQCIFDNELPKIVNYYNTKFIW